MQVSGIFVLKNVNTFSETNGRGLITANGEKMATSVFSL